MSRTSNTGLNEALVQSLTESIALAVSQAVSTALVAAFSGVEQQPEPSVQAKRSTRSAKPNTVKTPPKAAPKPKASRPLSVAEGDPSICTKLNVVLEHGYAVMPDQDAGLRKMFGLPKAGPRTPLLTMGDVVALVQDYNAESRGNGSTHRIWADFRVHSSKTRLSSHQVRYILRNGNLRGYKKPVTK